MKTSQESPVCHCSTNSPPATGIEIQLKEIGADKFRPRCRSAETNSASFVGGLAEAATGPTGPASFLRVAIAMSIPEGPALPADNGAKFILPTSYDAVFGAEKPLIFAWTSDVSGSIKSR